MTRKELAEEIEFIHSNRMSKNILGSFEKMCDAIHKATTTYTNLSLFMNDYIDLYLNCKINGNTFKNAINALYLLALLHTTCDEDLEHDS